MNAPVRLAAPDSAVSLLRTLVVSDLAESTALVERLGDQRAAEVFRAHDRLVRDLIAGHGGQEIDKTDGFLSMFERPVQAVAFALAYQRALVAFNQAEGIALAARTGIHVGDVVVWQNAAEDVAKGAKPLEVEGLVKPVASRLMGLALPNQILLSGVAYSIAHRAGTELGVTETPIRWRTHGRYRFKGVPDAVPVFEVGEEGLAPLKAPAWTGKAHRETPIWRRPLILGMEAVLALALLAIPAWYVLRPEPAIAFANRDWVVVGDLNNLTGDTRFDDALQAAFRIGLEQSRYVNVLSDLQVRDALTRMQRDPAATGIDRAVGSEVAQREGARALILPTIAEIGGRVRFTAEVVDPHTQTTVYSDSADGLGEDSVLSSVDDVNRELRQRLGEAMATVSQDAQPLEKVATGDFDALRAYTLAARAYDRRDFVEAINFYTQAISVDPGFARARIALATIARDSGDRAAALLHIRAIGDAGDRLSAREKLHVAAWEATLAGSPRIAVEKWKILADLYPDFFAAQGAHGFFTWLYGNDIDDAITSMKRNVVTQNPRRGTGHYVLGTLYLAKDRYQDAIGQFAKAEEMGARFENNFHAAAFAAQRKFDEAAAALARGGSTGLSATEVTGYLTRAIMAADQGRWSQAVVEMQRANDQTRKTSTRNAHMLDSIAVTMRAIDQDTGPALAAIDHFIDDQPLHIRPGQDPGAVVDHQRRLLIGAWLSARAGGDGADAASAALARMPDDVGIRDYPELSQRMTLAQAAIQTARGDTDGAIGRLRPLLNGKEFYAVHLTLMDAHAAAGDYAAAADEARWLTEHRGRAYAEMHGDYVLALFNVAQSNLALLSLAEFAMKRGDSKTAAEAMERFDAIWPPADRPQPVSLRAETLASQLTAVVES